MSSGRKRNRGRTLVVVGGIVLLLAAGLLLLPGGNVSWTGNGEGTVSGTPTGPLTPVSMSCALTGSDHLNTTPATVNVAPLAVQTFSAILENPCGVPASGNVSFSWWLSSDALGALNTSGGPTIAYTACLAPMGGLLHVSARSGGTTVYSNASIWVSGTLGGGSTNPGSGAPSASPPSGIPWMGVGIVVVLLGSGGALLFLPNGKNGTRGNHGP